MKLSVSSLADIISLNYDEIFPVFSKFPSSEYFWKECMRAVHSTTRMNYIILCNDDLKIPPLVTFVDTDPRLTGPFTKKELDALNTYWSFLFHSILGYPSAKEVPADVKGITSAVYFYGASQNWKIVGFD